MSRDALWSIDDSQPKLINCVKLIIKNSRKPLLTADNSAIVFGTLKAQKRVDIKRPYARKQVQTAKKVPKIFDIDDTRYISRDSNSVNKKASESEQKEAILRSLSLEQCEELKKLAQSMSR